MDFIDENGVENVLCCLCVLVWTENNLKIELFEFTTILWLTQTVKGIFKVYLNGKHLLRFQSEDGKFLMIWEALNISNSLNFSESFWKRKSHFWLLISNSTASCVFTELMSICRHKNYFCSNALLFGNESFCVDCMCRCQFAKSSSLSAAALNEPLIRLDIQTKILQLRSYILLIKRDF